MSGMIAFSLVVYSRMMRAGPAWLWSHAMLHRGWADATGTNTLAGHTRRVLHIA